MPQISDYRVDFYFQDTLLFYTTNKDGSIIWYNAQTDPSEIVTSRKGFKFKLTEISYTGEMIFITLHNNDSEGYLIWSGFTSSTPVEVTFDLPSYIESPICFNTDSYTSSGSLNQWVKITPNHYIPSPLIQLSSLPQIQISCSTPDSQIYYTLDNSTPDSSKSLYSNQFEVESGTTIKAIAIKDGYIDSDVAEYVVN